MLLWLISCLFWSNWFFTKITMSSKSMYAWICQIVFFYKKFSVFILPRKLDWSCIITVNHRVTVPNYYWLRHTKFIENKWKSCGYCEDWSDLWTTDRKHTNWKFIIGWVLSLCVVKTFIVIRFSTVGLALKVTVYV